MKQQKKIKEQNEAQLKNDFAWDLWIGQRS